MKRECSEQDLARVLKTAWPATTEGPERKAVAAMIAAASPRLPRRSLLVGAAVLMVATAVGIGLVQLPGRHARGVWARALAAAAAAESLHVVGELKGEHFEQWISADGFSRAEVRHGDELRVLAVTTPEQNFSYEAEEHAASVSANPPGVGGPPLAPDGTHLGLLVSFAPFVANCSHLDLREHDEAGPHGRSVEVVEAAGTFGVEQHDIFYGPLYKGTPLSFRAVLDADTGLLISLECWKEEGRMAEREGRPGDYAWEGTGNWQPFYRTDSVEWNVPIPQELAACPDTWPAGTTVYADTWFADRGRRRLASGHVAAGEVTLHALEANAQGELYVTVSRPGASSRGWVSLSEGRGGNPKIEGRDDLGRSYRSSGLYIECPGRARDYVTTVLRPDAGDGSPAGEPHSITLSVWPSPEGPGADESVTFADIAVPARQPGTDLWGESRRQFSPRN